MYEEHWHPVDPKQYGKGLTGIVETLFRSF